MMKLRYAVGSLVLGLSGAGLFALADSCTPAQSPPIVNELVEAGLPQEFVQYVSIVLSDLLAGKTDAAIVADIQAVLPDSFVGSAEQIVLDIVTLLIDTGTLDTPQNAQAKPHAVAYRASHTR